MLIVLWFYTCKIFTKDIIDIKVKVQNYVLISVLIFLQYLPLLVQSEPIKYVKSFEYYPEWQMIKYMVSHADGNLVFSPWGATGSGSLRAGSDVCVCHLETTARTGGRVQGKTCILLYATASVQFRVTITEGEKGIIGCYAIVTSRQVCVMTCVLVICLTQNDDFHGQKRPLTSGSALTCWLPRNRCRHTTDSVTNPLKMDDLRRVTARKNDQAHYMHAQYKPYTDRNKRETFVQIQDW